jgi:hypothetical protein
MITFALSVLLSVVSSGNVGTKASACETLAPRLDGISVVVCGGKVYSYTDASGNTIVPSDY